MTTLAPKHALFLDLETTGLDPYREQILEIGFMLVDTDTWQPIEQKAGLILTPQGMTAVDSGLSDYVHKMHTESGLLDELKEVIEDHRSKGKTPPTYLMYEDSIIKWLESIGINRRNPTWGSSVHFDRKFLGAKMPRLNELMHYRVVDSSSDMERLKLRYPALWKKIDNDPTKYAGGQYGKDHRVLEDIAHSVDLERRLDKWVYRPAASVSDLSQA